MLQLYAATAIPMYRNAIIFFFLLFAGSPLLAQTFRLTGKVTTSKLEPLAFASVQLKDAQFGSLTKEDGTYEIKLEGGTYELVVTMIGYKSRVIPLVIRDNFEQNIILEEDTESSLGEVIIRTRAKDRADEIMHNLVRRKDSIKAAVGPYSGKVYIKAVQQDSGFARRKGSTEESGRTFSESDILGMAMAEISLQVDHGSGEQVKETRLGVRRTGNHHSLFYLSVTEGDFNFYDNLIKISVSPTPFVSPVSYSGLVAYKFKTLKVQRTGKYRIYTISVKPRQLTNATVEGEITVSDSSWSILHCRFRFPSYHLQEYDFFEVEQDHEFVQNRAWMVTRQQFNYHSRLRKGKLSGQTTARYSDFQFDRSFARRHFGNEISATAAEAYQVDSTFWQTVRTEPLTDKELRYIRYQDSILKVTQSKAYHDSVDKERNTITWKKIGFFGQSFYNREKDRTWYLPPVVSLYQPFAFGGGRINTNVSYHRIFPSRKDLNVYSNLSYGLRNNDINGSVRITRLYNPFNRGMLVLSAGRDFQFIYEGDAWINMIKRNNIYLNNSLGLGHSLEVANGLFLFTDADIAFRRSVSHYKTGKLVDSLLDLDNNQPVAFEPYNAFYGKVRLSYTPAQRYVREPKQKIILGSKWPTFYVEWRKGIPEVMKSKVDFDYLEFGMEQQVNTGLTGVSKYSVRTGSFPNRTDLRLIDYQFVRRGDPLMFSNPQRAFQAMDSTFPVFNRFWEGHLLHEFNGFFLNRIPLLKKLKLREVAGAGFLVAPERNLRYAEVFAGVERAFESPFNPLDKIKIGFYVVGSAANQFKNPVLFKIGFTTWDKRRNKWF
jgi:hypothetical protein